jgi:hypothetical protein
MDHVILFFERVDNAEETGRGEHWYWASAFV